LLDAAGFAWELAPWQPANAVEFWFQIAQALRDGALPAGRTRLLEAALSRQPANAVFLSAFGNAAVPALGVPSPPHGPRPLPAGAVRVGAANPAHLGVHPAVALPGMATASPPVYVTRDVDRGPLGVRRRLRELSRQGGFLLLLGESSVGKTRTAYEAIRAVLPNWSLLQPDGPAQLAEWAMLPLTHVVVWLDEFDAFLDRHDRPTAATIRRLLGPPGPVVLVGTMWPGPYLRYITMPDAAVEDGPTPRRDAFREERQILSLALSNKVDPTFSEDERRRAVDAARADDRLAQALSVTDFGITQTLAGAPGLMERWRLAPAYAKPVLTAAITLRRLGVRQPLSAKLLRAAAEGYRAPDERAAASGDWFERALAYAMTPCHGKARALTRHGDGAEDTPAGYRLADYLHAHADNVPDVPAASVWDAASAHVTDPDDALRLAQEAVARRSPWRMWPFLPHCRNSGDGSTAWLFVDHLVYRGRIDLLRVWANDGDWRAAVRLADVLVDRGDVGELRERADRGDRDATLRLAEVLSARGTLNPATAEDPADERRVIALLDDRAYVDELRRRAGQDGGITEIWLGAFLAVRGDVEGLRALADDWHPDAGLLLHRLRTDPDLMRWPPSSGPAGRNDVRRLDRVLAAYGDEDRLRERADQGHHRLVTRLSALLTARGDLEELANRADRGDRYAAARHAQILISRDDTQALKARANTGDVEAQHGYQKIVTIRGTTSTATTCATASPAVMVTSTSFAKPGSS
jgi:hypothetical protein